MDKGQIDKRYLELAEKWMTGEITPEEESEFAAWYNADQEQPVNINREFAANEREHEKRMLEGINRKTFGKRPLIVRLKSLPVRLAAASVLLLLCAGLLLILQRNRGTSNLISANTIAPGKNKAVLTLSDGKKILLDDSHEGEIAKQSGIKITKKSNGQLVYTVVNSTQAETQAERNNMIETPNGGQYQINLPDHTKIWLNAASSLKFPVVFSGHERKVVLSGEAYFEVAPDKTKPFIVISDHSRVEVLGTHFNISAYREDETVNTTLLEGSVVVSNASGKRLLIPGQQALVNKRNNQISISQANERASVAWKNGYFYFYNEDIRSVMAKISRWYNVEVVYQGDVQSPAFGGTFSRYKKLPDLLGYLHEVGNLNFKLEERRVIVMK